MMLSILSEEARARRTIFPRAARAALCTLTRRPRAVARIKLVKPDKAREIEDALLQAARRGRLQGPVPESQVVRMLEEMSKTEGHTKVTFKRRAKLDDGEDDDNDDDL